MAMTMLGGERLAGQFQADSLKVAVQAGQIVEKAALNTVNLAKQLAPVQTGQLRRSIHHEMLGPWVAEVGTNLEYGPRVEHGFVGADSLGRVYDQAPRAFLGPAFDIVGAQFAEDLRGIVRVL